jgi:hypothetical protein
MSTAGWVDVWNLAVTVTGNEPVPVKILIGLGAAFVAVMFLEGVHASFLPTRYAALLARKYPASNSPQPRIFRAQGPAPSQAYEEPSFTVPGPKRAVPMPKNLKRQTARVSRHRSIKPRIRRVPMVNAEQTFETQELPSFSSQPAADPQLRL